MTQQHLANLLGINQAAVSKMERRADMYISTLQSMIRAMGGRLKIEAVFPEARWRSISSASSRKALARIEGQIVVPTFTNNVKVGQPRFRCDR